MIIEYAVKLKNGEKWIPVEGMREDLSSFLLQPISRLTLGRMIV